MQKSFQGKSMPSQISTKTGDLIDKYHPFKEFPSIFQKALISQLFQNLLLSIYVNKFTPRIQSFFKQSKEKLMDHQNLTDMCMDYEAERMDLELCNQDPPLREFFSSHDSSSNVLEIKDNSTQEDDWVDECDENIVRQDSTPLKSEEPQEESENSKMPRKRKPINKIKFSTLFNSYEESESHPRKAVKHRRKRGETNGYPTKNFLPNFKGPHIQFLEDELGEEVAHSFEIVRNIKDKNGISMNDYETLYNEPKFEKAWKKFFKTKVLYRELMISRSSLKARRIHMKKLYVFEEAFLSKEFSKIN